MRLLFVAIYGFIATATFGQETIKYYDKQYNEVKNTVGYFTYFVVTNKKNDSTFFVRTYKDQGISNILVKCVNFKDSKLSIRNGIYSEYKKDGLINLLGNYTNDKKDGLWILFNDSIQPKHIKRYYMDSLMDEGPKEKYFNTEYFPEITKDSVDKRNDEKNESIITEKFRTKFTEKLKKALKSYLKFERVKSINFYHLFVYFKNTGMQHILLYSFNYELDNKFLNLADKVTDEEVFDDFEKNASIYKPILFKITYDYTVRKIIGTY